MNKKITLLKTLLFVLSISTSINLQAQDSAALLHLQFENNLNASGGFTFETNEGTVPFSSTNKSEGSYSLYFSGITSDSDASYPLIDNSSSAQISSTSNLGITGNDARTVSVWIKYDNLNTDTDGSHCIVNIGDPSSASQGRNTFTFAAANNKLTVAIGGGNVNHEYSDGSGIEDGNWHHVAYTLPDGGDMSDITFYIDGSPVSSDGGNNSNAINTTNDVVYIATRGQNSQKWFDGGGIDDLRIYDYELSETEMATVYSGSYLNVGDVAFKENELKAYPNAVEDFLYLQTTSNSTLDINVFDITGKVIIKTHGSTLDMSSLNSGLYIVNVREDNKVANLKILKK
jgi:hypothetical protein